MFNALLLRSLSDLRLCLTCMVLLSAGLGGCALSGSEQLRHPVATSAVFRNTNIIEPQSRPGSRTDSPLESPTAGVAVKPPPVSKPAKPMAAPASKPPGDAIETTLSSIPLPNSMMGYPRTALVIGNNNYRDGPLTNPVHDAEDMKRSLEAIGFDVILRTDVNTQELEENLAEFSSRLQQRKGIGLFFYAGHGAQLDGRNYLIPVKGSFGSEADIKYKAVDAGMVLAHMEQARASLIIVILDACRDNPFGRGFRSYRGGGLPRGLAQMDAPAESLIAYATAPGSVAADGSGRNSPYTGALLQVMKTPGLKIEDVFKQVRKRVMEATGNQQVPWESSSLTSEFYFVTLQ